MAQTLTIVESLNNTDGAYPFPGLVQATNGQFYGTTYNGGANLQHRIANRSIDDRHSRLIAVDIDEFQSRCARIFDLHKVPGAQIHLAAIEERTTDKTSGKTKHLRLVTEW
jgi:hypothetical protein